MEVALTIILVIAVIVLLNRPKRSNIENTYTSAKKDYTESPKQYIQNDSHNHEENEAGDAKESLSSEVSKIQIDNTVSSDKSSGQTSYSEKRTLSSSYGNDVTVTINGKTANGKDAEDFIRQIFGSFSASNVSMTKEVDFEKEFKQAQKVAEEETRKRDQKKKAEERKKQRNQTKLKRELDDIVRFIWADAQYENPWNPEWEGAFANIMFKFRPSKMLYGMYEHLLSDYPRELDQQQMIWIQYAVKMLYGGSPAYIYYDNDDSILEEYKYLHYPSKIQEILFENANEYPKLIAAMAAWSVYECDIDCLRSMLSQYQKMGKQELKDFAVQLVDSMSRTRKEIFNFPLGEIKEIIDEIQSFLDPIEFDDSYDEKKKRESILYLIQGYDEKATLEKVRKMTVKKKSHQKNIENPGTTNITIDADSPDLDRTVLLYQLSHVRWQYNYASENPEDKEYIRADINNLTHIDWDDVDRLIGGDNQYLSSQMKMFKEAAVRIKKFKIWNKFDRTCPDTIEIKYKYPDGKAGDVNRGLALCYGIDQPEQVDALTWKVQIDSRKYSDIIDMMINGQLGVINDAEETKRIQSEAGVKFLIKYNNYAKLRSISYNLSSINSIDPLTTGTYYSIASSVPSNYYHQLREARDLFYQELIVTTGTSSKWKSEQQVYAVTRFLYADAVYQYHTQWLGKQSLDVFIPSLLVGIEYQGKQHYEPVDFFGGEEGFRGAVERDARKKALCEENGVKLVYWKYDEPINSDVLKQKLNSL